MEAKINISKILKDKPQGTKLYDWLHNIDVELDTISTTDTETVVWCTNETNNNTTCHRGYSEFGTERGYPDGLQILFPSKKMRDWAKFSWKKGDLLINSCEFQCIFKEWAYDDYTKFNGCYSNSRDGYEDVSNAETANFVKLDDNTAYGYVREIERKLGGILNIETLMIEKTHPEFKDGDIVCISGMGYLAYGIVKSIDNSSKKLEYYVLNDMSTLKFEDWLSFEDKQIQPITETQRIILFDALANEGKAWDSDKKAIVDLKPKVELKPFDKVLCRNSKDDTWEADFFARLTRKEIDYTQSGKYLCVGDLWMYCIPYNEETAHLLGTTDEWKGGEG
jgi:hypothetical protein